MEVVRWTHPGRSAVGIGYPAGSNSDMEPLPSVSDTRHGDGHPPPKVLKAGQFIGS